MKITRLLHEREQHRHNSSGQLLQQLNQQPILNIECHDIIWQRTQPHPSLVKAIEQQDPVLLTPHAEGESITEISQVKHFIVIDGTWQESSKIYTKSPYLHQAKWHQLKNIAASRYNLRRNQVAGGLCTVEAIIFALQATQHFQAAAFLEQAFQQFLQADRRNQQKY